MGDEEAPGSPDQLQGTRVRHGAVESHVVACDELGPPGRLSFDPPGNDDRDGGQAVGGRGNEAGGWD